VLVLNLTTGTFTSIAVNPDRSGGSSDLAVWGTTAYFANQSGGSITVPSSGDGSGTSRHHDEGKGRAPDWLAK